MFDKYALPALMGLLCFISSVAYASSGGADFGLGYPEIDHKNQASLQRGAKNFMNYCSGCHSLKFMRYNRMAQDIGITTDTGEIAVDLLKANLMFTSSKVGEHIEIAMRPKDAESWFGTLPPDLSLETRARGEQWIYDYLLGFYADDSRPWGVNNLVFKDVGMPHVLTDLQGKQKPVYRIQRHDGKVEKHIVGVSPETAGKLTSSEYKQFVNDLVNFLSYVGNPVKEKSKRIGLFVLLFLAVAFAFAYALKREYWKDVH